MKVLIVHISDIHLRPSGNACEQKFASIATAVQNEVAALDGVIVVVSGDVAYSGSPAEYEVATTLLAGLREDLAARTRVAHVQFVFVPGNHDCNFEQPNTVRDIVIDRIRSGQTTIDDAVVRCCTEVEQQFFSFRDRFPTGSPTRQVSPLYWEYVWKADPFSLRFNCYNTAWVSQRKETQGTLYFPEAAMRGDDGAAGDYAVSVFHHPYNWMPADAFRSFRARVEQESDLILTGHEHEPEHFQKYSFSGETNEYLEGGVLQEHANPERATFHAVFVDLESQRQRVVTYSWDGSYFVATALTEGWRPYRRGARGGKEFQLEPEFEKWLDDPGASYTHPAKPDLRLSDIYVFPNLKQFEIKNSLELKYGSIVEGRDVLKSLGSKRRLMILGRQQAGKTTMAKVLFRDFYAKNLTPILLSGEDIGRQHLDIEKFDALVESCLRKQYRNPPLPKFQQIDRDKTVIIIDDFDDARLNIKGRLKLLGGLKARYDRTVVFADEVLKLEEIATGKEGSDAVADYDQFEILQFGHLLRSKLIERWYGIGSEFVADPEALEKRIYETEKMITALLGKNYLPSYPVFVLSLVQVHESATQPHSNVGTYGSLYEALIVQSLANRQGGGQLELKMTYLSEFAFWMFQQRRKRISDEDWIHFHSSYTEKYKINPSRQLLKEYFRDTGIVTLTDERYSFRHSYSYYYFVARYLRDNLAQQAVRDLVGKLCEKLNVQENASIWLFLTHLSRDPFLVEVILKHARGIFGEFPNATLGDDVKFLKGLAEAMDKIVLHDKPFSEVKEERLRKLDSCPAVPETEDEVETDEALNFISRLNAALRTLEVLGQLVKNFPGSLVGADKFALVNECYGIGLRTISMLLSVFQKDCDEFVELVVGRIIEQHPEITDRDEFRKRVKGFMFWLIEATNVGMIKRTSLAVGHSALGETYREVREKYASNAVDLIDISIKLDNLGFPDDELQELSTKFKGNVFCERILRQLVVEHFYLFPTKETTKQRVCSTLQIDIRRLRQIEVRSIDQRQVPPEQARP